MREHFKGNVKELAINTCKIFIFMYLSPLLRLREAFLLVVVFEWTGKSFLSLFFYFCSHLKVLGAFDHMVLQDHGTN